MARPPPLLTVPVRPAEVPPAVRALADRLPPGLRMGTCSWSFPGWAGLVYARAHAVDDLAARGLAAYAAHPLLRTVSLDRGYYAPIPEETLAEYAAAVPEGFSFVLKAHEALGRADDPRFLDPAWALDRVVGPARARLGDRLGPILLQLPPQAPVPGWPDRLARFLEGLGGARIAVEPRFAGALSPGYAEALAAHGAAHCLSVHPALPDLRTQWRLGRMEAAPFLCLRWNLPRAMDYEGAKAAFAPFDRLVAEGSAERDAFAKTAGWAHDRGRPCWITVNNKAEGCAPLSVVRLAERVAALR